MQPAQTELKPRSQRKRILGVTKLHFVYYLKLNFYFEKILDSLCWICLWLTLGPCLLLYLENTAVFMLVISFYLVAFLKDLPLKLLCVIKPVRGTPKVWDH